MKKGTIGIIVFLFILACWFVPGLGNYALSFLVPPRLFYVIGAVVIIILLKILREVQNKKEDKDE